MNVVQGNDAQIRSVIRSARQAAESGRAFEAENLLRQAQMHAPRHPLVLNETAMRLMRAGRSAEAERLLADAERLEPGNPEILFNHVLALRALARTEKAMAVLDRLLAIDRGHMAGLFEKASIEEERGELRTAAATYHAALQMLPPNFQPPRWMERPLKRARQAVEENNRALEAHVAEGLADLRSERTALSLRRFDQCVEILLHKRRIFRQQPTFLYYPELPAIEFYDRDAFPWLDRLEAAADAMRAELESVLAERGNAALEPYIADQAGLDLRYYRELNRSRRWGVYPLWREGVAFPEHIARCPKTAAALRAWPPWDVPGSGPTALFSILAPRTRIPAHTGPVNTRLVVHLPLIVPEGCGFRVGGQIREWQPGKAFVFDDTIDHEAWNNSDMPRAILIVDTWSPYIDPADRELIRALTERMDHWYKRDSGRDLKSA